MTSILIVSIIVLLVLAITLFISLSPQFGGKLTRDLKQTYSESKQWNGEKFENTSPTSLDMPLNTMLSVIAKQFEHIPNRRPDKNIAVQKTALTQKSSPRMVWFGHSTFLLELGNKNILLDPMFGDVPAPLPWLGQRRYSQTLPIAVDDLPSIDAVLLSHDHYDHLDYGSILKLKSKVDHFFVPVGVGRHLIRWGIKPRNITELDWWEESTLDDIQLALAPARHFSGRSFGDRTTTLWGSWVIISDSTQIFFSGDSGYDDHFKEIGTKYGPFDFAMLECGQYYKEWKPLHMTPEQTIQAAIDVRAQVAMPIHWGAFTLAFHAWTDPVERAYKRAQELEVTLCTPQIGEPILIGQHYPQSTWWRAYGGTDEH